jgi:hypothetical protein
MRLRPAERESVRQGGLRCGDLEWSAAIPMRRQCLSCSTALGSIAREPFSAADGPMGRMLTMMNLSSTVHSIDVYARSHSSTGRRWFTTVNTAQITECD